MSNEFIARHAIASVDPSMAAALASLLKEGGAGGAYVSATKSWEEYCSTMKLEPYPASPVWLAAWMTLTATRVQMPSLKVYLSGIRAAHVERNLPWEMSHTAFSRATFHKLKLKFGWISYLVKVPITLDLIQRMGRVLPGWPVPSQMSHDDRLFILASLLGTLGFLRGGEFLASASGRPTLKGEDLQLIEEGGVETLLLSIHAPKARPWIGSALVRYYHDYQQTFLDPLQWYKEYCILSPVDVMGTGPALRLASGQVLGKAYMVNKTHDLLTAIGATFVDVDGNPVMTRASSWRSGGVQMACQAKLGADAIRACGRWSSSAWLNYRYVQVADMRSAILAMQHATKVHIDHLDGRTRASDKILECHETTFGMVPGLLG